MAKKKDCSVACRLPSTCRRDEDMVSGLGGGELDNGGVRDVMSCELPGRDLVMEEEVDFRSANGDEARMVVGVRQMGSVVAPAGGGATEKLCDTPCFSGKNKMHGFLATGDRFPAHTPAAVDGLPGLLPSPSTFFCKGMVDQGGVGCSPHTAQHLCTSGEDTNII